MTAAEQVGRCCLHTMQYIWLTEVDMCRASHDPDLKYLYSEKSNAKRQDHCAVCMQANAVALWYSQATLCYKVEHMCARKDRVRVKQS